MKVAWLTLFALLTAVPALAEQDSVVHVEFSNPALYPAQWTLVIHPDGNGHFHAEGGTRPTDVSRNYVPGKY